MTLYIRFLKSVQFPYKSSDVKKFSFCANLLGRQNGSIIAIKGSKLDIKKQAMKIGAPSMDDTGVLQLSLYAEHSSGQEKIAEIEIPFEAFSMNRKCKGDISMKSCTEQMKHSAKFQIEFHLDYRAQYPFSCEKGHFHYEELEEYAKMVKEERRANAAAAQGKKSAAQAKQSAAAQGFENNDYANEGENIEENVNAEGNEAQNEPPKSPIRMSQEQAKPKQVLPAEQVAIMQPIETYMPPNFNTLIQVQPEQLKQDDLFLNCIQSPATYPTTFGYYEDTFCSFLQYEEMVAKGDLKAIIEDDMQEKIPARKYTTEGINVENEPISKASKKKKSKENNKTDSSTESNEDDKSKKRKKSRGKKSRGSKAKTDDEASEESQEIPEGSDEASPKKAKKSRSRRKKGASSAESDENQENESSDEQPSSHKHKKKRKKSKKQSASGEEDQLSDDLPKPKKIGRRRGRGSKAAPEEGEEGDASDDTPKLKKSRKSRRKKSATADPTAPPAEQA